MPGKGHLVGAPRTRVPKRHDARPERAARRGGERTAQGDEAPPRSRRPVEVIRVARVRDAVRRLAIHALDLLRDRDLERGREREREKEEERQEKLAIQRQRTEKLAGPLVNRRVEIFGTDRKDINGKRGMAMHFDISMSKYR